MGERAAVLAQQYEEAVQDLIGLVQRCTDEQWQAHCADEGWTVAVTAHHVTDWWPVIAPMVQAIAAGAPVSALSIEAVHKKNADHAERERACTRVDTIALLQEGSAAVARQVREIPDEHLDRNAEVWGRELSAQRLIERNLIGHARIHTAGIRAATGL
jgi:hypothetical protein